MEKICEDQTTYRKILGMLKEDYKDASIKLQILVTGTGVDCSLVLRGKQQSGDAVWHTHTTGPAEAFRSNEPLQELEAHRRLHASALDETV